LRHDVYVFLYHLVIVNQNIEINFPFIALTLFVGRLEEYRACKN